MNGQGKYYWNTGDVYEGNFKNGVMEKGDVKYTIGIVGSGIWSERKVKYDLKEYPESLRNMQQTENYF